MNRGNRRIIVASIILTLPLAILLGSFSTGAPPYKAAHRQDGNAAAQSSGNQQGDGNSQVTGGILHAFFGSQQENVNSNRPATQRQDRSAVVPAAGVLDGLVDAINPSNKPVARNQQQSRTQVAPNWDGIPFHTPTRNTAALKRAPIHDPSQASLRKLATQPQPIQSATPVPRSIMVNAAPAKSIQARPVSSRIGGTTAALPTAPTLESVQRRVAVKSNMPSTTTIRSDQSILSTTQSSRRSGRRSLEALDPSEIAAASTTPDAVAADQQLTDELIPKATRRIIVNAAETEKAKIVKATQAKLAAEASAAKAARDELAAIESKVAQQVKVKPVPAADVPAADVKANAKTAPKPSVQSTPMEKLAESTSVPQLAAPSVSAPATSTSNNQATLKKPAPLKIETITQELKAVPAPTPKLPALASAVPVTAAPTELKAPTTTAQLSAPSTNKTVPEIVTTKPAIRVQAPSAAIAHRADSQHFGPPADAFDQQSSAVPRFAPIGSGVIDSSDNESLPESRIAQGPGRNDNSYGNSYDNVYRPEMAIDHRNTVDPYVARPYIDENTFNYNNANPQVTRPMRSAPAAVPSVESNFQPRSSANVANEMRPPTQAAAKPAQKLDLESNGVASELPGIRVVTHGPKQIMIRQTYQFEIRVENRGSIDADGVMVRAMIPDWAEVRGQDASRGSVAPDNSKPGSERLVWTIDKLPAGSQEKMFVRLKAERSGTHGLDVDWTLVPQKSVTTIEVREPRLELTIEGPEEVVFGQSQTYRVRVLNPGDGIAPNVVFTLSPNSPTPQTQRIGDIPPGKEAQFEVELTAQDLGDLKIAGLASGDLELRAEAAKTIRVSAAKLEAMLTGPELKYQDAEASYNLEIANKGIATSEKITASLKLPAGVKYIGGLSKAVQRGSMLTWQVDALPPTAVRTYKFQCKMNATGEQMFAFDCKGSAAGQARVSLITRVESIADLVMTINDPAAPAPVGADVTYEIIIRNRGSKAATDVRAIAQFSHGIEPRRVEGQSGELLTGQVLFDPIQRIAPGEEVRLKIVANAARPGHHRFRSEIRSGDTILVSEEATHYMNAKSDRVSRRSTENQTR